VLDATTTARHAVRADGINTERCIEAAQGAAGGSGPLMARSPHSSTGRQQLPLGLRWQQVVDLWRRAQSPGVQGVVVIDPSPWQPPRAALAIRPPLATRLFEASAECGGRMIILLVEPHWNLILTGSARDLPANARVQHADTAQDVFVTTMEGAR
jgi:hypothetical protein